jgi:hypothetical protein
MSGPAAIPSSGPWIRSASPSPEPRGRSAHRRSPSPSRSLTRSASRSPSSPSLAGAALSVALQLENRGDTTEFKSYHIVQWNGKKYRLTHLFNDGTQTQNIGFTENDWKKLADQQIAMWETAKAADALFTFSNSSFHVESGSWKYRPTTGSPIKTVDSTDASLGRAISAVQSAFDFDRLRTKGRPMSFVRGNPPRPTLAAHQRPPAPPSPPASPLAVPPALPEVIPWYRIDKHLKNLFSGTSP